MRNTDQGRPLRTKYMVIRFIVRVIGTKNRFLRSPEESSEHSAQQDVSPDASRLRHGTRSVSKQQGKTTGEKNLRSTETRAGEPLRWSPSQETRTKGESTALGRQRGSHLDSLPQRDRIGNIDDSATRAGCSPYPSLPFRHVDSTVPSVRPRITNKIISTETVLSTDEEQARIHTAEYTSTRK